MRKIISLIKVSLNHDMNIFKISSKKQGKFSKILPLVLALYLMSILATYSNSLLYLLKPFRQEFIVITLFSLSISFFTLIEGIYKSSSLLFNSKDDDLLLSLPIKKRTILFIRIFKFYVFELLYNSLFLLPVIIVYAYNVKPDFTYYLSSFIALLVLPIVPILISVIIGFIITFLSSKFKGKNIFQTIFTTLFLLIVLYVSFNANGYVSSIVKKASDINDLITRLYYPVGAYISLINNFSIKTLIEYIIYNTSIFLVIILTLSKIYFKINSNNKRVVSSHKKSSYIIKNKSKPISFIKKELNRFLGTPVFIINAIFGLVLFILICIVISLKFDSLIESIVNIIPDTNTHNIKEYLPIMMFILIVFSSFMTFITSSMISLEGKSFNILKSLPLKPIEIIMYKVLTSLVIVIPCILVGDIIIFIRFKFNVISIILILLSSFILPLVSELIGILFNLKYPKMDASNDTEVVKQSMSTLVTTFTNIGMLTITIVLTFILLNLKINNNLIMIIFIILYVFISLMLLLILNKKSNTYFNNINA